MFGEVLDGADSIDRVELALVLSLPPEDVPWDSQPLDIAWLVDSLRPDKAASPTGGDPGTGRCGTTRSAGPVRFWSLDGPDENVVARPGRAATRDLPRDTAGPTELREQTAAERPRHLARLRAARGNYCERAWRREHRGTAGFPKPTVGSRERLPDLLDAHRHDDPSA